MSKELYHRFTEIYLPGQPDIKNNDLFSDLINKQIEDFSKKKNVISYRIVNCETQAMPPYPPSSSDWQKGYIMLIVHIAYIK